MFSDLVFAASARGAYSLLLLSSCKMSEFVFSPDISIKITKWKVRESYRVSAGQLILLYVDADGDGKEVKRLKSPKVGVVQKRLYKDGDVVPSG